MFRNCFDENIRYLETIDLNPTRFYHVKFPLYRMDYDVISRQKYSFGDIFSLCEFFASITAPGTHAGTQSLIKIADTDA